MTLSEIALMCEEEEGKPKPPSGQKPMNDAEVFEYARWWKSLTPRERLDHAKRV